MAGRQSSARHVAGVLLCTLVGLYSLSQGLQRKPAPPTFASSEISHAVPTANRGHNRPTFDSTVVTAYFDIPSKRTKEVYIQWIPNMMKLDDAMVVFTSPDMVSKIRSWRETHASNRTLIVPVNFDEMSILDFDTKFWEHEYEQDPQGGKRLHIVHGWQLYKFWLMKPYFVNEAIRRNPFGSSVYVWSDIGQFRNDRENWSGKRMIVHPEVVPESQMLFLATTQYFSRPRKPENSPWFRRNGHFVAGGSFAGRPQAWKLFLPAFEEAIRGYVERGLGVYDDQPILLSTCLQRPDMCRFITLLSRLSNGASNGSDSDDFWTFRGGQQLSEYPSGGFFSFKYLLHHGGKDLDIWYPGRDGVSEDTPLMTAEEMQQHGLQLIDTWEGATQARANRQNIKRV